VSGGLTGGYAKVTGDISNAIDRIVELRDDLIPMTQTLAQVAAEFKDHDLTELYGIATNVQTIVGNLDLETVNNSITQAVETLTGMTNLDLIADSVDALTAQLVGVDLGQMSQNVSNIYDDAALMVTTMGEMDTMISIVTSRVDVLENIDLAAMETNVTAILGRLDLFENVPEVERGLSNLVAIVGELGNLMQLRQGVSNIVQELQNIDGLADVSTNVLDMKAILEGFGTWPTNFAAVVDDLSGADLSVMAGHLTNVQALVRAINLAGVEDELTNVVALLEKMDIDALTLTISDLTNRMAGVDFAAMGINVTNILGYVEKLNADELSITIAELTNRMAGADFVGMGDNITEVLGIVGELNAGNLSGTISNLNTQLGGVSLADMRDDSDQCSGDRRGDR